MELELETVPNGRWSWAPRMLPKTLSTKLMGGGSVPRLHLRSVEEEGDTDDDDAGRDSVDIEFASCCPTMMAFLGMEVNKEGADFAMLP